jgi:hypothetical protein
VSHEGIGSGWVIGTTLSHGDEALAHRLAVATDILGPDRGLRYPQPT